MATIYYKNTGSNTAPYDTWAKAATTMATAIGAMLAGDTLAIAHDTADEVLGATTTWTFPGTVTNPCKIISVDSAVASGWTSSTTMTNWIGTNGGGNYALNIAGPANACNYFEGVQFCSVKSATANTGTITLASANATQRMQFRTCKFKLFGTGSGQSIATGNSTITAIDVLLENCELIFGNTGNSLFITSGKFRMVGGSIAASGSVPTTMLTHSTSSRVWGPLRFDYVDLSAFGTGKTLVQALTLPIEVIFHECRLPSGWATDKTAPTLAAEQTTSDSRVYAFRTAGTGLNYTLAMYGWNGNHYESTAVVRTGGATAPDNTLTSWKVTTGSACKTLAPFEMRPVVEWCSTTGAQTVTIYGVYSGTTLPTDQELWAEVGYLGNASYPLGTPTWTSGFLGGAAANTFLTADTTKSWDGGATTRANSTVYAVGTALKPATPNGKVYFVTATSGANQTAGSEPANYGSNADGTTFTDGDLTITVGYRFKLTTSSITINQAGPVVARVKVGKASIAAANALYIDPDLTIA